MPMFYPYSFLSKTKAHTWPRPLRGKWGMTGKGGAGGNNGLQEMGKRDGGGGYHGYRRCFTQIMIPYCCLTGSAVFLRGSFFESAAIRGGGVRLNCTGRERGLLNCSHSNNICPSSELSGVACPGVFAAWRGCEGWWVLGVLVRDGEGWWVCWTLIVTLTINISLNSNGVNSSHL